MQEQFSADVGSADIASLHGCNLLGQRRSCCRGAYICRPCTLGCLVHAAYGLRQRVPFHTSSSLLDYSDRSFLINNMIIFDYMLIEHTRFY